jgi:hypothetical protein
MLSLVVIWFSRRNSRAFYRLPRRVTCASDCRIRTLTLLRLALEFLPFPPSLKNNHSGRFVVSFNEELRNFKLFSSRLIHHEGWRISSWSTVPTFGWPFEFEQTTSSMIGYLSIWARLDCQLLFFVYPPHLSWFCPFIGNDDGVTCG